ncbi:glycosyltransferase family 2 protein [Patescibacteria group bacterium]|uniref:dolichyl-phosphate beta-glucosyltransferase n=1 Tax=candidate division WWE3 bacterium TaxID=2053526 RepID=A0A928TSU1_UNCKA|nr:glycosyltransferase family 2 protein [candidate division WWE3 bacterium]MCL4732734.1 glycosyltransferase family 2 protein [Patescibacteria group bacterium]MDL1952995.1 glycosyltransferase family 2 protein [Candidatus Uhrbacteria bacterium UHB]RIL00711.1 MAG: hypothetical protein DCC77_04190 [Candidatus Uhrbacteria bacterium]
MPSFSVIIPAYQEEKAIQRAIAETARVFQGLGVDFEIIVVDDGSRDRTSEMALRGVDGLKSVRLLRHPDNQGKGSAIRTGVASAEKDWIVFLDADLATHPSDIRHALPHVSETDLLIGSRSHPDSAIELQQPAYRVFSGQLFNLLGVRMYLGLPYKDTQCGFKLFRRELVPLVRGLQTDGWVFDVELIARARQAGFRIREIPVTWRHGRETRVKLSDAGRILRDLAYIKKQRR